MGFSFISQQQKNCSEEQVSSVFHCNLDQPAAPPAPPVHQGDGLPRVYQLARHAGVKGVVQGQRALLKEKVIQVNFQLLVVIVLLS